MTAPKFPLCSRFSHVKGTLGTTSCNRARLTKKICQVRFSCLTSRAYGEIFNVFYIRARKAFLCGKKYNINNKKKELTKNSRLQRFTIGLTYFFCSLNFFQSHIFFYINCSGVPSIRVYISWSESLFYDHAIWKKNMKNCILIR